MADSVNLLLEKGAKEKVVLNEHGEERVKRSRKVDTSAFINPVAVLSVMNPKEQWDLGLKYTVANRKEAPAEKYIL
jgi:hypothetical protein